MNTAGFLEKLLDEAEVAWMPLKKLVKTVTAPSKAQKNDYREHGSNPIVDQGITFIAGYADESFTPVACDEYVIFGDHSEHIKYVDFAFVQGADGLKILKPEGGLPKYIYHALLNFYQKTGNYKRHWSKAKETLIPIPCPDDPEKSLAIQGEIVRILDKFTLLTAELTAELTARKKQYNYYRDQLLTFDEDEVEWRTLGDVCDVLTGGEAPKNSVKGSSPDEINRYPIFGNGAEVYGYADTYKIDRDAVTISSIGANTGTIYFRKAFFTPIVRLKVLIPKSDNLLPRYTFHYLSSINIGSKKSSVPNMNAADVKKIRIPIPFADAPKKSLEEQARIVAILDKFDTLTTSITEGLPREIELREKQYNYYRDLLLSFPKPDAEAA